MKPKGKPLRVQQAPINVQQAPLFYDAGLSREYQRWVSLAGANDPYATRGTIGLHQVLRAHFMVLDFFLAEGGGEGVGGIGPKDLDRLHSAVYRQFVAYGGREKWVQPLEKCATLLFGIVKDHPFHDANKRTAFLITLLFLERIGRVPRIKQKEFEDFVVDIADSQLSAYPRFSEFESAGPDPEINFIADYLKRNTRDVDHQAYAVSFVDVNHILRPYGFELTSPKGNYIDVVRIEHRPKYLGLVGPKVRHDIRVAQIGFPGWKRQVTRAALRTIREATGLTAANGYDSKVFYQGADPLHALIDTYAEPLRRLADR